MKQDNIIVASEYGKQMKRKIELLKSYLLSHSELKIMNNNLLKMLQKGPRWSNSFGLRLIKRPSQKD